MKCWVVIPGFHLFNPKRTSNAIDGFSWKLSTCMICGLPRRWYEKRACFQYFDFDLQKWVARRDPGECVPSSVQTDPTIGWDNEED